MSSWYEIVTKWEPRKARTEILGAARTYLAACPFAGPISTNQLVQGILNGNPPDPADYPTIAKRIARELCNMAPAMSEASRGEERKRPNGSRFRPWLWEDPSHRVSVTTVEKEDWEL